jgi:serine/threonine protein phosphatase PrpC
VVEAHGLSNAGPVRKTNEDSFISDPALQLFMVADGMGGHAAGEIASSLAVETITGFIRRTEEDADCSWPYGVEPALSFASNRLRTAIHLANRRVFRAAERHDEYTGMGTTIVGAFISGSCLTVANAGDSRLYLSMEGRLTQEATMRAAQRESPPAVRPSPAMRHVLTNTLGAREQVDVHVSEHDLSGGEMILLCSDGLHGVIDDTDLEGMLNAGGTPADIVPHLIDVALTRGTRDNVTAILVRFHGE